MIVSLGWSPTAYADDEFNMVQCNQDGSDDFFVDAVDGEPAKTELAECTADDDRSCVECLEALIDQDYELSSDIATTDPANKSVLYTFRKD